MAGWSHIDLCYCGNELACYSSRKHYVERVCTHVHVYVQEFICPCVEVCTHSCGSHTLRSDVFLSCSHLTFKEEHLPLAWLTVFPGSSAFQNSMEFLYGCQGSTESSPQSHTGTFICVSCALEVCSDWTRDIQSLVREAWFLSGVHSFSWKQTKL